MNNRRGRPRGGSDARQRILRAAETRFVELGYAATSVRAVARDAEVDHSLVAYHFGCKEGLFREVTRLALSPGPILDRVVVRAPEGRVGRTLLEVCLAAWESPSYQDRLETLLREALTVPQTHRLVREFLEREAVARLTAYLGGSARASRRASAAASLIAGIYFTRYLIALEPIASLTPTEVVDQHAPALNLILAQAGGAR